MKQRALSTIGLWLVVGLMLAGFNAFGQVKLGGFLLIALLGLGAQYEVYAILRQTGAAPRSTIGLTAGALFLTALFMGWVTLPPAAPWVALAWVAVLLSLLARPLQNHAWVLRLSTLFGVLYVPFLLGFLVILASEPQGLWAARPAGAARRGAIRRCHWPRRKAGPRYLAAGPHARPACLDVVPL